MLAFAGTLLTPWSAGAQTTAELRARAADATYNLDHDEALGLLRQAVARDPNDPANHRALASAIWLDILFKRGAVTVDHYLGSFTNASVDVKNPPAGLDAEFKREIAKAIELAERRATAAPERFAVALRARNRRRPPGVVHRVGRGAAARGFSRRAGAAMTRKSA